MEHFASLFAASALTGCFMQGGKVSGNSSTNTAANLEQAIGDALLGKEEVPRFDSLVRISIHSVRKRLADSDGISGKAAIDGIVKAGILADDSPKFVKEVTHSQETGKEEITVIRIEEVA